MKKLLFISFCIIFLITGLQSPRNIHAQTSCPNTPTSGDSATLSFSVPENNTYTIWTRLIVPDTINNSVYLQIDGGCAMKVGDSSALEANQFTWVNYKDGNTASITSVTLTAGDHTAKLIKNEGGVGVDRLLVTTNTSCVPTGSGTNCPLPTSTPVPTVTPVASVFATPTMKPTSTPVPANIPTPTRILTPTVTLKPTATPTPGIKTVSLNPTADSYIDSSAKTTNYGTVNRLVASASVRRAFLKFNTVLPATAVINSVMLQLYSTNNPSAVGYEVHPALDSWTETSLTWNSQPAWNATILATSARPSTNTWLSISLPVTSINKAGNTNFGFRYVTAGINANFASREDAVNKPKLIITYH